MSVRPHRILHVISALDIGGAESMLREIVTAGRPLADESVVVSLLPKGFHARELRAHGIHVVELDFKGPRLPASLFALVRVIRSFKPTIIQSWMYHSDLAALIALKMSGRRALTKLAWGIRCSDMDLNRYHLALRACVRVCAALSRTPDLVIANSDAGMKIHLAMGYRPVRASVIHNGIDLQRFKPDAAARAALRSELGIGDQAIVLAHIARVDPMKDHANMLAAAAQLPGTHTLLVGAGTENLPDAPRVHRLGRRTDVPRILASADFVVSSSAFGEGFSNVLAEGMACGLPAVATDVGDARLIIGDTGLVVPPSDAAALAAAIAKLAQEPAAARQARRARVRARIVENFSIDRALSRFAEAYAGLST